MKKILIIGAKGLLGSELSRLVKNNNDFNVVTSDKSDINGIDITDEKSVENIIKNTKPDVVVNCAAYTDVDGAETIDGFKLAKKVNGTGPGLLAKYCLSNNADLIHISSDYVFGDNDKTGYKEDYSDFKPLNKYGESKLLGEKEIIKAFETTESANNYYILRTSWLFGKGATNFISKIIKYAKERNFLEVVTDETSSPTYVKDLSQTIIDIIQTKPTKGIYHVVI